MLAHRGAQIGEDDTRAHAIRHAGLERGRIGNELAVPRERRQVGTPPLLLLASGRWRALRSRPPCQAQVAEPPGFLEAFADAPDRVSVEREGGGRRHPTAPSIWSWIRRFISTAYSIGSSLTIGSMKPFTIIALASASLSPRLMR